MSFETFNLNPRVMEGVRTCGYTDPTPIQAEAIPHILEGKDIIGLAQTGTGKTAAFVLPILQRLMTGPRGHVRAMIISPTRELAEQICDVFGSLGASTGLRAVAIYGGVGMDQQVRKVRAGAEIVVACPGRLLDHLWKGTVNPSRIEILVIDEADRMFDMGFLPDIKNILQCLMNPRQTLLFSATMPTDIRKLVNEILHDPVTVQIGFAAPAATVSHAIYPVKANLKTEMLIKLLKQIESESVLVFTRTKFRAEKIAQQLVKSGFKATSLQGDLPQYRRQAAIDAFRDGAIKVLVATDIAARGIDILSISHVINYDMPDTVDAYTHRIGRTGRIEKTGEAFTLVTNEDVPMIRSLEKVLKAPLERRTIPGFEASELREVPSEGKLSRPKGTYRRASGQSPRNAQRTGRPPRRSPMNAGASAN